MNNSKDEVDLDLVDVINKALPFEKHLPGMNYCGPGTNLKKKLNDDYTVKLGYEPTDRVDEAALRHDIIYSKYNDLKSRHKADKEMLNDLRNIANPSWRERIERWIVYPILLIKSLVGSCILRIISIKL
jgi:hypothetical protein